MKKLLLLTFLILTLNWVGLAQVGSSYNFTQTQLTYYPLTEDIVLWSGSFQYETPIEIEIPDFPFDGTIYNSIFVSSNGFITFGSAPTVNNTKPISSDEDYSGAVSAFSGNLTPAITGNPQISYKLDDDFFIVQWQDVRRYLVYEDIISFQIILDFNEGIISVVYGGDIASGQNSAFPQVGLRGQTNNFPSHINNRMILINGGNWINSQPGIANNSTMYFRNTSPETIPSPGLTFTWTPQSSAPLLISPVSHDFGEVLVSMTSDPFSFSLSNTGIMSVTIDSAFITGENADEFQIVDLPTFPIVLDEFEVVNIKVTFSPTEVGLRNGKLIVNTDGGDFEAELTGTGYEEGIFDLPFIEGWDSGNFTENNWSFINPTSTWRISPGTMGNPPPCAQFHYSPRHYNYSTSLISPTLNISNTINWELSFDMKLSNYLNSGTEYFDVHMLLDSNWVLIDSFVNFFDLEWTTYTYNLDTLQGDVTRIRFEMHGEDNDNLNNWSIDNIVFNGEIVYLFELDPEHVDFGEVMTGTTSDPFIVTYANNGLNEIGVNSSVIIGDQSDYFILTDNNQYPFILSPGQSADVSVQFAPLEEGNASASLVISTEVGTFTSTLGGFGYDEYIGTIPFFEDWATGSFKTRQWSFDQTETNWLIQNNSGNPAPTARFSFSPIIEGYSQSLISPRIDVPVSNQKIALSYDLKLADYETSGTEWIKVYIWTGSEWQEVAAHSNNGNMAWQNFQYYITDYVQNETRIRFEASGVNSANISNWEIDNISLDFLDLPVINVEPMALTQEIPYSGTAVQEVIISNEGTAVLNYSITINYIAPATGNWLSVLPTSGEVAVGNSQIVQVSFDTNGLTIGNVYTAELIVENNDPDNPEVTISVTLTVLTSQNELVAKKIIIYPSPANQIINLQGINEIILIQIFNSSGQLIFGVENEGENIRQIDVSNLISGSYTMRFITTQNTYINHKLQIIK